MGYAHRQCDGFVHYRFLRHPQGPDGRVFVGAEGRQFVTTGICSGYITFSSFSLKTLNLVRDGEIGLAGANIGMSFLFRLLGVWAGHIAAAAPNQLQGG